MQDYVNLEIIKKRGSSINPDIHHSKVLALYSTFLAYVMERYIIYKEEEIQMSSSFSLNYKLMQGIFFSTENYKKESVSWNILLIWSTLIPDIRCGHFEIWGLMLKIHRLIENIDLRHCPICYCWLIYGLIDQLQLISRV